MSTDPVDRTIPRTTRFVEGIRIIHAAQPAADFAAEHDVVYFGTPEGLSAETIARLNVLGWFVDSEFDCMAFFT